MLQIRNSITTTLEETTRIPKEPYPGMPNFRLGMEAEAMLDDQAFIELKMAQGYRILDIGPDFSTRGIRGGSSLFYNMERTLTKDYEGYVKVS